ncbi:hypothetical protein A9Q87_13400 [Flavobacteriales bacterium 34_180_T64]|nr:hypothetical protein A9Q87_13400 [Flavobacteriales bacterium 34_180_T64]
MAKFITGIELTNEVCDIIKEAKKHLLIVSPFIQLDDYFKKLFDKHKKFPERHLIIAFGKNSKNPQRSLKNEDLNYFKDFPNISIIYIPTLHAKYYANEGKGIITSINLYDYSFDNNVEFGVLSETKIIGGSDVDKEAWDATTKILKDNYAVFVKRPNFKKKFLRGKDYLGSKIQLDLTKMLLNGKIPNKVNVFDFEEINFIDEEEEVEIGSREEFMKNNSKQQSESVINDNLLSATNLGKIKNKSFDEVIEIMCTKNYLHDKKTITNEGEKAGIQFKQNSKGNKWIVYPESLAEIL